MEVVDKKEPGLVQEQGIWYARFNPKRHVCIPDTTVFSYTEYNKVTQKSQIQHLCCFSVADFNKLLVCWNKPSRCNGTLSYTVA